MMGYERFRKSSFEEKTQNENLNLNLDLAQKTQIKSSFQTLTESKNANDACADFFLQK